MREYNLRGERAIGSASHLVAAKQAHVIASPRVFEKFDRMRSSQSQLTRLYSAGARLARLITEADYVRLTKPSELNDIAQETIAAVDTMPSRKFVYSRQATLEALGLRAIQESEVVLTQTVPELVDA
jgi:hypothetical protein